MPHQVAVFLENKPGKLERVTELLAAAQINIRAITIADSGDYGILKLLVDDPDRAYDILIEQGLAAARKEVLAMRISDQPGALLRIAHLLTRHQINIDDAYGFVLESGKSAVFVVQVQNPEETGRLLIKEGVELVEEKDLYYL